MPQNAATIVAILLTTEAIVADKQEENEEEECLIQTHVGSSLNEFGNSSRVWFWAWEGFCIELYFVIPGHIAPRLGGSEHKLGVLPDSYESGLALEKFI